MDRTHEKVPILVAEDDPDDRVLLEEALDGLRDYLDVHYVADGDELMRYLQDDGPESPQPKLIFLDQNMPKKNGRQALREIKQEERLRNIPIVIWTTSTLVEDQRLCDEIGADFYQTKPSNFADLNTAVMEIVERFLKISPSAEKEQDNTEPDAVERACISVTRPME